MSDLFSSLDGFAGLASLVNGLLLWPIVNALKGGHKNHEGRIRRLERKPRKA